MDIIQRLQFDAARCEAQFSKGVATNIEAAVYEIERLRAAIWEAIPWMDDLQHLGSIIDQDRLLGTLNLLRDAVNSTDGQAGTEK